MLGGSAGNRRVRMELFYFRDSDRVTKASSLSSYVQLWKGSPDCASIAERNRNMCVCIPCFWSNSGHIVSKEHSRRKRIPS